MDGRIEAGRRNARRMHNELTKKKRVLVENERERKKAREPFQEQQQRPQHKHRVTKAFLLCVCVCVWVAQTVRLVWPCFLPPLFFTLLAISTIRLLPLLLQPLLQHCRLLCADFVLTVWQSSQRKGQNLRDGKLRVKLIAGNYLSIMCCFKVLKNEFFLVTKLAK